MHREERQRQLNAVSRNGYIDNYADIRVKSIGRQFCVEAAIVWNLTDACGNCAGQTAIFSDWKFV
jgi:hypothetical protein